MTAQSMISEPRPLAELWHDFLQERLFVKNITQATMRLYYQAWAATQPHLPPTTEGLNRKALTDMVRGLRETPARGHGKHERSATGVNVYLRVINAFLKWMKDAGHIDQTLHVSLLRTQKKVLPTYSEQHLRALLAMKPRSPREHRIKAFFLLLVDTGARASEVRTLKRDAVDLDQATVKLYGKGRKERVVPFSTDARRVLYNWLKSHTHEHVFATSHGNPITARNAARDMKDVWRRLDLAVPERLFHTARRTFATGYVAKGGDLFRLQATLGHANLSTTREYVTVDLAGLISNHASVSPLATLTRG